jgi:uncharacterized protein YjiS (DUF1127 family)
MTRFLTLLTFRSPSAAFLLLRCWRRNARTRHHLSVLPPHLLRDIGLTPDQARAEASRAFWRDGAAR